jgi:molybdopterin synthase catalytic subunit
MRSLTSSELQQDHYYVEVTPTDLDVNKYIELVADDSVGAISTFNGVTRNNFMGKEVIKLEYEAYVPMAVKKLAVSPRSCWKA